MLPSTTPPQHRLYSQVLFALETRAQRYSSRKAIIALKNGVRQEQIDRLNDAAEKAVRQLPDIWSWTSDESVTAALIARREDLLATFDELAVALRSCMEAEDATGNLHAVKLERLRETEVELDELRTSLALLNPVHLAAAEHFEALVNEGSVFEVQASSKKFNDQDEELLWIIGQLYVKLDAAWRELFTSPSQGALESYIAVAQEFHAKESPLLSSTTGLLAPPDEIIAITEMFLSKLIATALVYETMG